MRRASRTVTARIHRLQGQLVAVERMIGDRRSCPEVLNQIAAIRSGLDQVSAIVLETEMLRSVAKGKMNTKHLSSLIASFSRTK